MVKQTKQNKKQTQILAISSIKRQSLTLLPLNLGLPCLLNQLNAWKETLWNF